jgi:hypothetical protein
MAATKPQEYPLARVTIRSVKKKKLHVAALQLYVETQDLSDYDRHRAEKEISRFRKALKRDRKRIHAKKDTKRR